MNSVAALLSLICVAAFAVPAKAGEAEKEPIAIFELGTAVEWELPGVTRVGPSVAVEFEPIKEWLEIEPGIAPLFKSGRAEWDVDLLFKKPFTLSKQVEFMIGAGPSWTFSSGGTKVAAEIAADFMIWPTQDRKYGWFVEPSYSYSLSAGHGQSLGVSFGLLIPIYPN